MNDQELWAIEKISGKPEDDNFVEDVLECITEDLLIICIKATRQIEQFSWNKNSSSEQSTEMLEFAARMSRLRLDMQKWGEKNI
jgi:hypothetical protein